MSKERIAFALVAAALFGASALVMGRADDPALSALYIRPLSLFSFARLASYAGSLWFLGPLAVVVALVLWRPGWYWLAVRPATALAAGRIAGEALRWFVNRPRPDVLAQVEFSGSSFPSGHALGAVAMWFALAQLIAAFWRPKRGLLLAVAGLVALLVGWSRVFLGVHWPSDVLSGWGLGFVVVAALPSPQPPKTGRVKARTRSYP